ncbi:glycosyltransferase [Nocardioides sp. 31GB23]|uniref:glycosyltransferase family 4 protein n=1 Tax=Nocardioides sp. 31GB23 TaxID=3156065 RepID=UPI0032AE8E98
MTKRVVLSNGFGQFHLAILGRLLERNGMLEAFLTGTYLNPRQARLAALLGARGRRASERSVGIPDDLVTAMNAAEGLHQVAHVLAKRLGDGYFHKFEAQSFKSYSRSADRVLGGLDGKCDTSRIYHFRAGFGGDSVVAARNRGMLTVCDHSIADPRELAIVLNDPLLPGRGIWPSVLRDIETADRVLVNSGYVRESLVAHGVSLDRIFVAHTPVEMDLLRHFEVPERSENARVSVLFAGTLEYRKGVDTYLSAARAMGESGLEWGLVGDWSAGAEQGAAVPSFMTHRGKLPRRLLMKTLASTDVFVFPSRAEGSARIVAEALAAGCWVVTTREAGSVVRDGVDGQIVSANDPDAVRRAISMYVKSPSLRLAKRRRESAAYAQASLSEDAYLGSVVSAYETSV